MIDDLRGWLSAQVDEYERGNFDALSKALIGCTEGRVLGDLINALLHDDQEATAATGRSYRHPNGFMKITLISTSNFQLRLHIWWRQKGGELGTENIHNHRWNFASAVLLGGYRYQEFTSASTTAGRSFYAYIYDSDRTAASYSLLSKGNRMLECSFDAHMNAGTVYTLRSEKLHRIINNPDHTTATLVLQGPSTDSHVEVFAENALEPGSALPIPQSPPEEIRYNLRKLAQRLNI